MEPLDPKEFIQDLSTLIPEDEPLFVTLTPEGLASLVALHKHEFRLTLSASLLSELLKIRGTLEELTPSSQGELSRELEIRRFKKKLEEEEKRRRVGQLSVGKLISKLEALPQDAPLFLQYEEGVATFGAACSYRGFYNEVAIMPESFFSDPRECRGRKDSTVASVLRYLKDVIVGGTFYGWKGGDYVYDESTPMWIAHAGSSTDDMIVGVEPLPEGITGYLLTTSKRLPL